MDSKSGARKEIFFAARVVEQPDSAEVWFTIEREGGGVFRFRAHTTLPEPLYYLWDFGDGNESGLRSPLHTFRPVTIPREVTLRVNEPGGYSYRRTILPFIEYDFESRLVAAVNTQERFRTYRPIFVRFKKGE